MGQKSNLITLRSNLPNLSMHSVEPYAFANFYALLRYLEKLLALKGIVLVNETLNKVSNTVFISLDLFYRSNKLALYRKKGQKPLFRKYLTLNWLNKLFKQHSVNYRLNAYSLRIKVLNPFVNKTLLSLLYIKLRKSAQILFTRRFNLFIEFLKITNLFILGQITSKPFLNCLMEILRTLSKRIHTRFISFLKILFKLIISQAPDMKGFSTTPIVGLKLLMQGRISGKEKASSIMLREGTCPLQSITSNIQFSRTHVYTTAQGAIGLQLWVHIKQ